MILKQLKRMHKNYNLLLLKNKNKYNNYYKKMGNLNYKYSL